MILNKMILSVFVGLMVVSSVRADDQSSGCGLGWSVTKRNSLVSSWVRSMTNVTGSNTIAMTSGTSGCAKHDIVMKKSEAIHYAEANYQKLLSEVAIGSGEHLSSFVAILGCTGDASSLAAAALQKNYETLFPANQSSPSQLLEASSRTIYGSELAERCNSLNNG